MAATASGVSWACAEPAKPAIATATAVKVSSQRRAHRAIERAYRRVRQRAPRASARAVQARRHGFGAMALTVALVVLAAQPATAGSSGSSAGDTTVERI